ncbi:MAG: MMPL family transporter [Treponema sp.]|nr:MMPL family transporter [Treponema sp.]
MKNFFLKKPKLVIIFNILLTIAMAVPLKSIKLENSIRDFFPLKHQAYQRLTDTEDTFGSMVSIGVSLETRKSTILTKKYLDIIRKITSEIETVENTTDVVSITNIDFIESDEEGIKVSSLLQKGDTEELTDKDVLLLQEKLNSWVSMYDLVVISNSGRATQIAVSVDPKAPPSAQVKALDQIKEIVEKHIQGSDLKMKLYGEPVIAKDSKDFMLTDLVVLIPLVVLVVLISLQASFVTWEGTLLPLLAVLMSAIWSCGLMSVLGITFSLVSSVIPVALIACGSAYGIHVMTHYYIAVDKIKMECEKEGRDFTKDDHKKAISEGIDNVFLAVILSAITTVIGFASLVTSPIRPLFSFAIFTALGIVFSLWLSMSLIPAILSLKSLDSIGKRAKLMEKLITRAKSRMAKQHRHGEEGHSVSKTLYTIYSFFCGTRPRLIVSSLGLVLISGIGISRLDIDTAMVNYFPESSRLRQDLNYVNNNFAGTNSLYLLFKSPAGLAKEKGTKLYAQAQEIEDKAKKSGKELSPAQKEKVDSLYAQAQEFFDQAATLPDMTNPEALQQIDTMAAWLPYQYKNIGKAVTYTDSIKKINQVWNSPYADLSVASSSSSSSSSSAEDFGFDDTAEDFGFGDIADDFGFAEGSEADDNSQKEQSFENPNIKYRESLDKKMTASDVQKLIEDAYAHSPWELNRIDDMVEAIHREMNYNGWAYFEVPYAPEKYMVSSQEELASVISNYNILLGDSIQRFVDDISSYRPKVVRMQIQLHTHSTRVVGEMLSEIEDYAQANLPEGYVMEATGQAEMEYVMTNLVVSSQLSSLLLSLALVILIISISFKSLIAGLIGSIPLAFTIILNYMMMGFLGIKLDLITSIIASVAIGVGIDYTIHFMTEYRELRKSCTNLAQVTQDTFKSSGMGIITNALAVGLGFLVLCLSRFVVLRYIGILIAMVMFTSSMLSMTIIPGIFNAFDPNFLHKGRVKAWLDKDPYEDANRRVLSYVSALARIDAMEHEKGKPVTIPEELIREIIKKHNSNLDEKVLFDKYLEEILKMD